MLNPKTLYQKIWDRHLVVAETADAPAVLYIDLHLIHEVTSPQAFAVLQERGLKVRRPERTLGTMDHSIPTQAGGADAAPVFVSDAARRQVQMLSENCNAAGIELLDLESKDGGIVHVVGPELGATLPGSTVVCGDSHTSTHGAFGALAFGIGTTEVGHVLATQCILQRQAKTMSIELNGELAPGVSAKDAALAVLARIGFDGGTGSVIEYSGSAVRRMSMEGRMTVCNLSIEGGARSGLVAPDQTTFNYLKNLPKAPSGKAWERAVEDWQSLCSDEEAVFDQSVKMDLSDLEPRITFGSRPDMNASLNSRIPEPKDEHFARALDYMKLNAGEPLKGTPIDEVFIGSCTNSRIEDLRHAAQILRGRRVKSGLRAMVVPGSKRVAAQAQEEGLDQVFIDSGCEWRKPGCSMCIAMNGDIAASGQRVVSTSNRNFPGRQGPGSRTFIASPMTAAASALNGCIVDPREFLS